MANLNDTIRLLVLENLQFDATYLIIISYVDLSGVIYTILCYKFLNCHGNMGRSKEQFKDTIKLADQYSRVWRHKSYSDVTVTPAEWPEL